MLHYVLQILPQPGDQQEVGFQGAKTRDTTNLCMHNLLIYDMVYHSNNLISGQ